MAPKNANEFAIVSDSAEGTFTVDCDYCGRIGTDIVPPRTARAAAACDRVLKLELGQPRPA